MITEYIRIQDDHKTGTFDSLEQKCTEMAKQGWRVIAISDGSTYRYATMEREVEIKEKHVKPITTRTKETR